jgi:hypothetical protein
MVPTPTTTAAARVPTARADRPLVRAFTAARRCSVPLVAVATPDPAATVAALLPSLTANGGAGPAPVVSWDRP